MADLVNGVHMANLPGLILFLVLWIVLFRCAHILVMLLRRAPLLGWAIGPLGITFMVLHEPSALSIWLDVLIPALVSAGALYVGLFTPLSPLPLLHDPFVEVLLICFGVFITSTGDVINAFHDLRYPLWGEVRVLRTIQLLQATAARIHFTRFGNSYLVDHFGSKPPDLLRVLSPHTRVQL
ncbi:MAG TPA: hypothetical protein VGN34_04390 [Ktedonobacteraceae bacterium]